MPLGWPGLPWSMQLGDLLFPIVVLAMLVWRPALPGHRLDAVIAIYLLGSALSIPSSLSPRTSTLALGKELYLAGVYLVLKAAAGDVGTVRLCRWLCGAVGVLAACSLVAAAVFYLGGPLWSLVGSSMPLPYVGEVFRAHGTLLAPEFFGNVLTLAIPIAAMLAAGTDSRAAWRAALAVMIVAELLTFSKSLAGSVVALAVFFWPQWDHRPVLRGAAAAAAVALVVLFNAAAIATVRRVDVQFTKDSRVPPPEALYGRQDDPAGADRIEIGLSYNPMSYYLIKKVAWHSWVDRPWLGTGLGTFPLDAERAYQEGRLHQAHRRDQAHSLPFGRLSETGLIGVLTLAPLLVVLWQSMLRASRAPGVDGRVAWALFAGVAGLLVNSINVDVMHFRFLWFAIGLTAAIGSGQPERNSR
jgi:O-antigen ligase